MDWALPATEIHLWQASLDVPPIALQQFAQTLSVDEQTRAQRFRFPHHRHRYIAGRGLLRTLLGRYLQTAPDALQFCYSRNGKPALAIEPSELVFNVSHSEALMLCAIARQCCIGVDVEWLRPVESLERLTQRFFSPQECAAIHRLSGEQQLRSFFQHWTCKEALLKAIGAQLTDLSAIELHLCNHTATVLGWENAAAQPLYQWSLQLFAPAPNAVAAVAVNAPERTIVVRQWQTDDG